MKSSIKFSSSVTDFAGSVSGNNSAAITVNRKAISYMLTKGFRERGGECESELQLALEKPTKGRRRGASDCRARVHPRDTLFLTIAQLLPFHSSLSLLLSLRRR